MSDILIKGIEMPKNGSITITVYSDMVWCDLKNNEHHGKVQTVPPHGRLIDADKLMAYWKSEELRGGDYTVFHFIESVDRALTVLEANNE